MNCLSFALRFWVDNKDYRLWYNSDHVINIPIDTHPTFKNGRKFLPIEEFGYYYFLSSFSGILEEEDMKLLAQYFNM